MKPQTQYRRYGLPPDQARRMLQLAEPMAPTFRWVAIGLAWVPYRWTPGGHLFLVLLAVLNLAQLVFWRLGKGIATAGFKGLVLDLAHTTAVSVLVGIVLPHREFLTLAGNAPLNVYASPTLVLMAMYPRKLRSGPRWLVERINSPVIDVAVSLLLLGTVGIGALLNGMELSVELLTALIVSYCWMGLAIMLGYALATVGASFAASESDAVRGSFEGLEEWLESDLRPELRELIDAIGEGEPSVVIDQNLMAIDARIQGKGLSLLTSSDEVSLAAVISHGVKTFRPKLEFERIPPVSDQVVSAPSALLISRALQFLLDQAVIDGARRVSVDINETAKDLVLIEHHKLNSGRRRPDAALKPLREELRRVGGEAESLIAGDREAVRVTVPNDL